MIFYILLFVCMLVFSALGYGLISYLFLYDWTIVMREITGGRRIVKLTKARMVSLDGAPHLKLWMKNSYIQEPPQQAIDITAKGRKFVEVYSTRKDHYDFLRDTGEVNEPFQPLTTNQRITLINQIKKAHARRKRGLGEIILPAMSMGFMVLVLVMLMIFWGDIAAPAVEVHKTQAVIQADQKEIFKTLQEMIQKKQFISSEEPPG